MAVVGSVTSIGEYAFSGYGGPRGRHPGSSPPSASTPSTSAAPHVGRHPGSVASIGERAFYSAAPHVGRHPGLGHLHRRSRLLRLRRLSVAIPGSVTSIGETPSRYPRLRRSPSRARSPIGEYAFGGCSGLTSVHPARSPPSAIAPSPPQRPASVAIPGSSPPSAGAFRLQRPHVGRHPDSVTSIGVDAFLHCSGLPSVPIGLGHLHRLSRPLQRPHRSPSGLGHLHRCCYTFRDCSSLTSVAISDSVASIDLHACTAAALVRLPSRPGHLHRRGPAAAPTGRQSRSVPPSARAPAAAASRRSPSRARSLL